jgi:anti-sigma regulatory factor (Ser/Thr protein kinase)
MSRTETLDPPGHSRAARELVREVLQGLAVSAETADTALLLVSEVVANAVDHGCGSPVLGVDVVADRMRVSVTDDADSRPRVQRDHATYGPDGRGLLLVEALASRWGVERRVPVGKTVWFEIDQATGQT